MDPVFSEQNVYNTQVRVEALLIPLIVVSKGYARQGTVRPVERDRGSVFRWLHPYTEKEHMKRARIPR